MKAFDRQSTIEDIIARSKRLNNTLFTEELKFKGSISMGNIILENADGNTKRKLRRIVEKRVCQDFWSTHKKKHHHDRWCKAKMEKEMTRQFGAVSGRYSEYEFAV